MKFVFAVLTMIFLGFSTQAEAVSCKTEKGWLCKGVRPVRCNSIFGGMCEEKAESHVMAKSQAAARKEYKRWCNKSGCAITSCRVVSREVECEYDEDEIRNRNNALEQLDRAIRENRERETEEKLRRLCEAHPGEC